MCWLISNTQGTNGFKRWQIICHDFYRFIVKRIYLRHGIIHVFVYANLYFTN